MSNSAHTNTSPCSTSPTHTTTSENLDEIRRRNETLRTKLTGGAVALTPGVAEFPDWMLGRLLYRLTLTQKSMNEDYSEGVFVFAGYCIYWAIRLIGSERVLMLSRGDERVDLEKYAELEAKRKRAAQEVSGESRRPIPL